VTNAELVPASGAVQAGPALIEWRALERAVDILGAPSLWKVPFWDPPLADHVSGALIRNQSTSDPGAVRRLMGKVDLFRPGLKGLERRPLAV